MQRWEMQSRGRLGRGAGVSRPALHLNAQLKLAEEEERNWWVNMEKLSQSRGSPPAEPCELLEASPETPPPPPPPPPLLLLLLQTDGWPSGRSCRRFQLHAAERVRFIPLGKSANFAARSHRSSSLLNITLLNACLFPPARH